MLAHLTLRHSLAALITVVAVALTGFAAAADEAERKAINSGADLALQQLYSENPSAKQLADKATAVLVFPTITKAGLGVGAEAGKGVLRVGGKSIAYYRTRGLSFGAQAGAQTYGYVVLFMTQAAYDSFVAKKGYELGVDGSIAVVDAGATAEIDTKSLKSDTIGIVFNEKGLMANLSIEGSKISQIDI
ncbi:MAG: YSC84-related protein [Pseudomonadota bacterium]